MRFSGRLNSKLYLFVIFGILSSVSLGGVLPFFEPFQIRPDSGVALGQLDNGENVNDEDSPNTIINSAIDGNNNGIANNGSTTSNSMKFAFSGTDNEGLTISRFECSMDGAVFVTCVSTNTVNVADGTHTFRVRSEDSAGNKDLTPASFTWTANTESSNTQIDFATDGNKMAITNRSNTRSNSMTFAFSGTDNEGLTINRFECSMDGAAFVTCVTTNTVNVADGTHTFRARSEDNAGNKDLTPASFIWTVDTTPSATSINSAIDGNNNTLSTNGISESTSIRFAFSGTDTGGVGVDHLECNIDNSKFVACTSPFIFPNLLKDGTHTFNVLSEDNAGNKDLTPASFTWTVDTVPPVISINTAIDGNNNTLSTNGNSNSTSIRFAFSGTDTGGVGIDHLECNMDNSKFVACTSPFIFYNVLKYGTHTFRIKAEDNVGNISPTPESFSWTVDTVPPITTINTATDGNKNTLTNNSNSNSASMSFAFTGNDTAGNQGKGVGISHFECNIDNSKFVACTSPFIFPNLLKDGTHTFYVLSEDSAGNKDLTPESFSWTVDTVSPVISINTATDGNSNFMIPGSNTSSNSMIFTFSGNDMGGKEGKGVGLKQYECSLDGASFSICTSPVQFTSINLPEGTHAFEISAEDNVGNINPSPESFTWTVDTEPPTTTIDSATDGNRTTISTGGNTSSNSLIFAFSATDTGGKEGKGVGIRQFECNIDNSNFTPCTSPLKSSNLIDGAHTLEVLSEDNVGNISPTPASFSWTVDTVPPITTINTAVDANKSTITNGSNTRSNSVTFKFSGNDTGDKNAILGIREFGCSIDNSNFTTCTSPVQFTSANISDGTHVFKVLAEDNVGNKDPSPESFTWTVDTVPPTTTINTAVDANKSTITNGSNTRSNSVTFALSGNDTDGVGVDHLECSLDATSFTTCTSPVQFTSANISDGTHVFKVLAEDNSTNKDPSPALFSWTVDTVPPETSILSATDGNKSIITAGSNTLSNSVTFAFSGNDTGGVGVDHLECSLDAKSFTTCTSPVQFTSANISDGTHVFKVLAEDNSTNKDPSPESFTWTVDTVPPTTTINTAVDANKSTITNGSNTRSNSVTFEFSGNDTDGVGVDHLECSLDATSFTTCTSPVQFTPSSILDGAHTFRVGGQDSVGNINPSPALFNWTVDTVPPTTTINTAVDGNETAVNNGNSTRSTSMTFAFSANDTGGNEDKGIVIKQFECSIDNSNFTACTSPVQSNNLTDDAHTLEVLSEDNVGNLSPTPASFSWVVDTKSPSISIYSATDGNNNFMIPGSNTSSNSMIFAFSANDTGGNEDKGVGINHVECSIDNSNFSACTSPVQFTSDNLVDGNHIFKIRSEDNVGNINPTPASFSWTVDKVPPTTTINTAVDANKSTITNGSNTRSNSVTFAFSGNDTDGMGIDHFECSIDNSNFTICTSPIQFTSVNLGDGTHVFKVLAEDNSTNKDPSPALFSWTIDTVPPETSILSATDGNKSIITAGSNTSSNSVTFAFSGNDTDGVGVDHLECSLDATSFTTCTSPVQFTSANISDGTHVFKVLAEDNSTNKDPSPESFTWTVDTVPPITTINTAVDANKSTITNGSNTRSNSVTFEFSGNDTDGVGVDHLECSLDEASFPTCTSPVTPSSILDGAHTFRVGGQDSVGNINPSPALFNWTVDTVPPTTTINTAVDGNETAINNGNSTRSTSMTFAFSANDTGGNQDKGVGINHVECSIDKSNFTACTSPVQSNNLTDGNHTLKILSEDKVGNKGSAPASFSWVVDTKSPSISIYSATDGNNNFMIPGSNTSSNSMIFAFSANDTGGNEDKGVGINHVECSIDNSNFTACTSPVQSISLTDGTHILEVRAKDNVGNLNPTPASFSWTVDKVPPTTTINTAVDANKSAITNGSNTRSNSVIFAFSGNDTDGMGIDHVECSIDNSNFTACTSPVQFTSDNLVDGSHIFKTRSVDGVENIDPSPASFSWTIDTVPPVTSIDTATDGNKSTISTGSNTSSNSVTFTLSGTDSGIGLSHFECSIDNSDFVTCTSPLQIDDLTDGIHTLEARAHDNVENKDLSLASFSWTIDTVPPVTSIDTVTDGNKSTISTGGNSSSHSAIFAFSATDTGGNEDKGVGINHFECSIDNSNFVTCASPLEFNTLTEGTHNLKIFSKDNVGNTSPSPALFSWTADTISPVTSIKSATDGNNQTLDNNDNTSSTSITLEFSGNDTGAGVDHLECSLDGASFTTCTSPVKYSSANISDGAHILDVRAEDNVGNTSPSPSSFTWTVDTVPPDAIIDSATDGNRTTISTDGNTSSNSMIFVFSATDTGGKEGKGVGINHFECSIDNSNFTACTSPVQSKNLTDGTHIFEVRAEDNVGNTSPSPSSFTWTVDTTPPTTAVDSAIDGNKSAVTNGSNTKSTSMIFTFSGNDTGGVEVDHLECSIDNSNFTACTSPVQSKNLTDGTHIFEVRAEDNVGNMGRSPSSFIWIVDTTPPATTIDSATDGHEEEITMNGNSSSNSLTLEFSGIDTGIGVDHFECGIDNSNFFTCTSPLLVDSLTDGTHTMKVLSEDNSTNKDPSPASFTWTADTTPPTTSINSATDVNESAVINGGSTKSTGMTFGFSGTDHSGVGIDQFECSIDNSKFVTCNSPVQFNSLKDGAHILDVRAEDNVGNTSPSPASFTWSVDTTPPATSINSATDGNKSAVTDGGTTKATSMTLAFSGTDTGGVDHFECSMDNSNFTICTSPIQFTSVNLGDGTHIFRVLAEDNSTNKDPSPESFTWTIDTVSPTTTIISATDGNRTTLRTGGNTSFNSMTFAFSANDTGGDEGKGVGINHFECNIDNSNFVTCTSPFTFPKLLKDGTHTFRVLSEDNSTNKDPSPESFTWTVDTTPPATSINSATDGNKSAVTNGGTTKATSMTFTFLGNDTGGVGVDHFECNIDGLSFVTCTSPFTFPGLSGDGQYTLEIRAEDSVGNKDPSPAIFAWTVDTTPPTTTVDSATDGNNKVIPVGGNTSSNSMIFMFSSIDSGVGVDHSECSIDSSNFTVCTGPIQFTSTNLGEGTHTLQIRSEDKVGNRGTSPASFNWTVDTVPPSATIDSATDGNKSSVTDGGSTKSAPMTFEFSGNDTGGIGIDHFECSIDNSDFVACTSPFTFPKLLKDGTHTFRVLSEDKVGNRGTSPASFNWTVDTVPPSATINSATDGNKSSVTNDGSTKSTSMTFIFSGNDTGGIGIDHFECSIDNSDFVTCTTPFTFPQLLKDGTHTFRVLSGDKVGNRGTSPASFNWTVDTVPPTTIIDSATDSNKSIITTGGNSSSNSLTITFSGIDTGGKEGKGVGISHFECSLDGASSTNCTEPLELNRLVDGIHTIEVISSDNVGNKDPTHASFLWTIDSVPPTTTITSAIDGNRNTVSIGGNTTSTSMAFTFNGTDKGVGIDRFECSVDGASFSACTSPVQFKSLADGAHTLEVKARDKVVNVDQSAASFIWTIDTIPPTTSIDSVTDGNKSTLSNGTDTRSNSVSFTFSGTDTGKVNASKVEVKRFECSIDNSNFTPCTSPLQSKNLTDGTRTFKVRAVDNSGNNDNSPELFTWYVDATPPDATINVANDGNNETVINGGNTTSTSMKFNFSGSDIGVGVDHFECSLDGASFTTCASPIQFNNIPEGSHTLEVRAEDKAGNSGSSPASFNWIVDTVPPTTIIDSATDGNKSAVTNDGSTKSTSMTFAFSGNDTGGVGIDHFECSIDNSDFVTCTSPFSSPNSLKDGTHTFRVLSEDKIGNTGTSPASFNWIVDTVLPTTIIDSATDGNKSAVTNDGTTKSTSMTFAFSGNDTGGVGIDHFECSIDNSDFVTCTSPFSSPNSLKDGNHTFRVLSEDKVGNRGSLPASFNWTVDTVSPTTSITSAIDSNRNTVTAGGNTTSTSMTFAFSGTDRGVGVNHFECSLDGASLAICVSPVEYSSLADGAHTLEVRAEDNVVNVDASPASFAWTIDTISPTTSIDSVVDSNKNTLSNGSNTRSNSITFTFSGLDTSKVNASKVEVKRFECSIDNSDFTPCTSPLTFPNLLSNGPHTLKVRAVDNSANNDNSPELFTWYVDATPPDATITVANDGNNETVTNGGNTTSTSMKFNFSGSDIGVGMDHFECSLDGASFTTCASPIQFNNIPEGSHTLEVRAEDKAGNEGPTPIAFIWTVNTKPPNTTINSVIDGNKNIVTNNSNSRSKTVTIGFSAIDGITNVDHFECSIDNSDFVTCTSPFTFPNLLSDGPHTFKVSAVDNSGHKDPSPALYAWTVDTAAPTTNITSATDGNKSSVTNGGNTKSTSMTFGFSGTDASGAGIDHFECSIEGASFSACDTPLQFTNLTIGAHTFEVRAEDKVGNADQMPTVFLWTITSLPPPQTPPPSTQNITTPPPSIPQNITTSRSVGGNENIVTNETMQIPPSVQPPDTKIVSATDGNGNAVTNDDITPSKSMIFVLSSSIAGIQEGGQAGIGNFECSIDGSSFSACTNPVQFNSLADGAHILEARSEDNSGNKDLSPASFTWTVDTVPPDTSINSAIDGNNKTITDGADTESTTMIFTFSGTDTGMEEGEEVGINHFECSIDGSSFATCTSPAQFDNLANGTHILEILSEDNSGNKDPSPSSFTWTVNTVSEKENVANNISSTPTGTTNLPNTIINSSTDGSNNVVNNDTSTPSNTIKFEFSGINIESVDHFECSMDDSDFVTCTSPFIFPNLSDGKHVFMVRFVEPNGNMDESPAAFVWDINR